MIGNLLTQNVLVETPCEEAVEQLVVVHCHGNHTSNKLEVLQMLTIDVTVCIRLIETISRSSEKCIIWIEHFSRKHQKECSGEPTCIGSLFSLEVNIETLLELFCGSLSNIEECIYENVLSSHTHSQHTTMSSNMISILGESFLEPSALVVKVHKSGILGDKQRETLVEQMWIVANNLIENVSVVLKELLDASHRSPSGWCLEIHTFHEHVFLLTFFVNKNGLEGKEGLHKWD
mmetsp:Transcript_7798/g.29175  ORF Transcript_7798/g.29175 Transcript_7798/m.29175 type:complete len:233 (+) Transcript_7798:755-1453(+)